MAAKEADVVTSGNCPREEERLRWGKEMGGGRESTDDGSGSGEDWK